MAGLPDGRFISHNLIVVSAEEEARRLRWDRFHDRPRTASEWKDGLTSAACCFFFFFGFAVVSSESFVDEPVRGGPRIASGYRESTTSRDQISTSGSRVPMATKFPFRFVSGFGSSADDERGPKSSHSRHSGRAGRRISWWT